MKPESRRKCTANMHAVNEENGSIFASAAAAYSNWACCGQCEGKLIAPLKYPDTMKSQLFEKWFEKDLLKELPYGSILIMDNASFYRKDVLYEILKKTSTR